MADKPTLRTIRLDDKLTWPSPYQKRRFTEVPPEALVELAQSITAVGVLEPILVRPGPNGGYELIAGERRCRASVIAEKKTIPAIVRDLTDAEAMEICVSENLHNEDLHPLDEGDAIQQMMEAHGSVDEVAKRLAKPRGWVARRARITALTPAWRKRIEEDLPEWGAGHLEAIARLAPSDQDAFLEEQQYLRGDMNISHLERALERWLRRLDSAPWECSDAELLPEAGACTACPLRASANPGLFDDVDEGKGIPPGDRCLSASCWDQKLTIHMAATIARLGDEEGGCARFTKQHHRAGQDGQTLVEYQDKTSPKRKRGYTVGVWMDGPEMGHVVWVKPKGADAKAPDTVAPESAAAKLQRGQERLKRRRLKKSIEAAVVALQEHETVPHLAVLISLAAVFGTEHKRDSSGWGVDPAGAQNGNLPKYLATNAWEGVLRSVAGDLKAIEAVEAHLWRVQLVPVLVGRWAYYGSETKVGQQWKECGHMLGILEIDAAAILKASTDALTEPKTWKKLRKEVAAEKEIAAK